MLVNLLAEELDWTRFDLLHRKHCEVQIGRVDGVSYILLLRSTIVRCALLSLSIIEIISHHKSF